MLGDVVSWTQLGYGNHKFTLAMIMCRRSTQDQVSQIISIDYGKDLLAISLTETLMVIDSLWT